jgi:hypothetical protein
VHKVCKQNVPTADGRIRAFDDIAERVRNTVRRGQAGVEDVVHGFKHWTQNWKTKDSWVNATIQGCNTGMVSVPRKYREKPERKPTQ